MDTTQKILVNDSLEVKPANPLLLRINDEHKFEDGDIRLMFFGQETNNWYDERRNTVKGVQEFYDGFFNEKECWNYRSPFWNGIEKFLDLLDLKYPNKEIRILWNNIIKIGRYKDMGTPPSYIYQIERGNFKVIEEEIEITKPNLIIFFTGPNYDQYIRENFGNIEFKGVDGFSDRTLAEVKIIGVHQSFRTYHPSYLQRIGIDNYLKAIVHNTNF